MADPRSSEEGTNIHGLFGAIIVESPQSAWLDPQTGKELESGLFADIYTPGKPAFREYAVFFHDELEIRNKDGVQPTDPHTGLPSSTTGISYRAEPMCNRPPLTHQHTDSGEDISMSSWVYKDPAPPHPSRLSRGSGKNPADPRRSQGNPRFSSSQSSMASGGGKPCFLYFKLRDP